MCRVKRRPDTVGRQNVNLPTAVAVLGNVLLSAAVARLDRDGKAVEVKLGIAHLQIGEGEALEDGEDPKFSNGSFQARCRSSPLGSRSLTKCTIGIYPVLARRRASMQRGETKTSRLYHNTINAVLNIAAKIIWTGPRRETRSHTARPARFHCLSGVPTKPWVIPFSSS
jgi:hypothetical protein